MKKVIGNKIKKKNLFVALVIIIIVILVVDALRIEIIMLKAPVAINFLENDITVVEKDENINFPDGSYIDKIKYIAGRDFFVTISIEIPSKAIDEFQSSLNKKYYTLMSINVTGDDGQKSKAYYQITHNREGHLSIFDSDGTYTKVVLYDDPSKDIYNIVLRQVKKGQYYFYERKQ